MYFYKLNSGSAIISWRYNKDLMKVYASERLK